MCKRCGRELPVDQFHTNARYGIKSICKECEHKARSEGQYNRALSGFTKDQLLSELKRRGLEIMASPTPRELMVRLKKLGYEGELRYVETKVINLKTIE